jgi:DNA polymerase-3 subunit epsilon
MALPVAPAGWVGTLKREWGLRRLRDPRFRFLWAPPPAGEWVALAVGATGRDPRRDRITALAALRIQGDCLLTSTRLEWPAPRQPVHADQADPPVRPDQGASAAAGLAAPDAAVLAQWLEFIGSRPMVGYFLDFDLALLDRAVRPLLGVALPNPRIEVSALFHGWKFRQLPPYQQQGNVTVDLRFATLVRELGLPARDDPDALDRAVLAGLAWLKLQRLQAG